MNYLFGWNPVAEFVLDEFRELNVPVEAVLVDDSCFDPNLPAGGLRVMPVSAVDLQAGRDTVVNCLGYRDLDRRLEVGEFLERMGVSTAFVSRRANVAPSSVIGIGCVLLGDVVVERACVIGGHALLWGGSRVCHDSHIGKAVFMASGSVVGGFCDIGSRSAIGFNSSVKEKSSMPPGTRTGANRFWRGFSPGSSDE
jgi:hypothetical protein